ncbi:MAG: GldG family protein [Planctomycetes bacterium]|nr:GldG family protein [Planctomycetota bacterium]
MTTEPKQPASLVEWVARKREPVAGLFIAIGVLLAILAVVWGIRFNDSQSKSSAPINLEEKKPGEAATFEDLDKAAKALKSKEDYLPAAIWSGLLALLCIGTGVWRFSRKPEENAIVFESRLWLLMLGVSFGFLTTLLGLAFAYRWQESILLWVNDGEKREARWVLASLAIILAGLVAIFLSLQLARSEERNSVLFRRLLYGGNAVVSAFFLLLILVVVNVFVFLKLPDNVITTATAFRGLSQPAKEFLHSVDEPVTLYLVMPENLPIGEGRKYSGLYADCRALLKACQDENPLIKVKALSPIRDGEEINRVMKKAPEGLRNEFGILIAYGKSEDSTAFVPLADVLTTSPNGAIVFQGENQLLTEMSFVSGGSVKPVIYFTQGNGEPTINPAEARKSPRSAIALVQNLTERKYEIKPLVFEQGTKPNLSDAAMIVVAAPLRPLSNEQQTILSEYMKPKGKIPGGKLVAILPAFADPNGKVAPTGLEDLLAGFAVKVEERRLFTLPIERPAPIPDHPEVIFGDNLAESREFQHRLLRFLHRGEIPAVLPFRNVRPISTQNRVREGQLAFNLFQSLQDWSYQDEKFFSNPLDVVNQIRREIDGKSKSITVTEKNVNRIPVPFAAYFADRVEDGSEMKERPRLLVIGTDSFLADDILRQSRIPDKYINIMGDMIDFMREKPKGINVPPREFATYALPEKTNAVSLFYLPVLLIVLGIVALGVGVWVTRRT